MPIIDSFGLIVEMKYTKMAVNVSGRGDKIGTDRGGKQVIYIT